MIAIITGDIVNSREVDATLWMKALKDTLQSYGQEPGDWEIYRGDSFQLKTTPTDALLCSFLLKSSIKTFKQLDVRIAIGIGEVDYQSEKITESNGSAFVRSGECFEGLKKQTLAMKTEWEDFDERINLLLEVISLVIDDWTPISSTAIHQMLQFPELNQKELAEKLDKKSQSTISEALKRGGFDEMQKLLAYYKNEISKLC